MSETEGKGMPERDLDLELDHAIDALNDERQPTAPTSDSDRYWAALEAAMLVRSLQPPAEPDASFSGRLAAGLAGDIPARSPNGHVHLANVASSRSAGRRSARSMLVPMVQTTGAYVLAGMLAGVVVGGVGARIAMRVSAEMFAREHPNLIVTTESSGNRVGQFTWSGTFYLLAEAMIFGLIGGLFYLVARRWLPRSSRAAGLVLGLLLLLIAGATVFSADNRDFTRIGSPAVNVLMFGAIFVVFGLALAPLSRWITRLASPSDGGHMYSRRLGRWMLGAFGVLGMLVTAAAAAAGVVVLARAGQRFGDGELGSKDAAATVAIVALTVVLPASRVAFEVLESGVEPASRRSIAVVDWAGRAGLVIAVLIGAAVTLAEIGGILDLF